VAAPRPFVLVHGAWHGAWSWERLAARLRGAGHAVYTPTLASAAERVAELSEGLGLSSHVAEVADLFAREDRRDAVLVGHSYGGFVITGAWSRIAARVHRLVYIDAFFPENGRSFRDYCGQELWTAIEAARPEREPWRSPFPVPVEVLGIEDPGDREHVAAKLSDFPYAALTEPASLPRGGPGPEDASYVLTSELPTFVEASQRAGEAGLTVSRLEGGHDALFTNPDRAFELLTRLTS